MLQPSSVERHTRLVQARQRLLKLAVIALAIISTMTVLPTATKAATYSPLGATITVKTTLVNGERRVTIAYRYSARVGGLAVREVHIGFDGWRSPQVLQATRTQYDLGGITYEATLTLPSTVRVLDFAFTDGVRWDNNHGADYHAVPGPWTPTWAGALTPQQRTAPAGAPVEISAQVYAPGVTDTLTGGSFNDDLIGELWYSAGGPWQSAPLRFQQRSGNNHVYSTWFETAGLPSGTTIAYTCRFSADEGRTWRWCDLGAAGNGTLIIE